MKEKQGILEEIANQVDSLGLPQKMRTIILSLLVTLGASSCDTGEINERHIAKEFVEEFTDIEHLDRGAVTEALSIIEEFIVKLKEYPSVQKYIGSRGMDACSHEVLLALSIPETRANSDAQGGQGEEGLFQISPRTKKALIERIRNEEGRNVWNKGKDPKQFLENPQFAGAIVFLQSISLVDKLIEDDFLDWMGFEDRLKVAYVIHNRGIGNMKEIFERFSYRSWDDFEDDFLTTLRAEGFRYKDWKKKTKQYNNNPSNAKRKKKVTKIKWLQEIRRQVNNYKLQQLWNSYLSGCLLGESYKDAKKVM